MVLTSRFRFDGGPVRVTTLCHPTRDVLAVRIESAGLAKGRVGVRIEFPYALGDWGRAAVWGMPDRHRTVATAGIRDGVYAAMESAPFTVPHDHPSMLAALGFLPPTPLIEPAIMRATLEQVWKTWDWPSTWGWDYPMMAMTAARMERPDLAVEVLLRDTPKNRWLPNGHNYQRNNLPLYLPGDGGLLYAVAMMAAGWDGGPDRAAPGFPSDGSWVVKTEGLRRAP